MARNVFSVNAMIVGSDGTFYNVDDYPKAFDSKSYNGDVDKALARAEGEFSNTWGAMCKRDDRLIQTVTLTDVFGNQLERKSRGNFPAENEE